MKLSATLLAVQDMARSRRFYCDVLGLCVTADFGANISLSGTLSLQTADSWKGFIGKSTDEITLCNNACEVYFETDQLDSFLLKLQSMPEIIFVHPVKCHSWGQRAVRFYDPDGHIIEVGEPLSAVAGRFANEGFSVEEIAAKMDISAAYAQNLLSCFLSGQ